MQARLKRATRAALLREAEFRPQNLVKLWWRKANEMRRADIGRKRNDVMFGKACHPSSVDGQVNWPGTGNRHLQVLVWPKNERAIEIHVR